MSWSIDKIVTSVATSITAFATLRSLCRQLSKDCADVFFSLKRSEDKIILEIKNTGTEIARNVRVKTIPNLVVSEDKDEFYEGYVCSTSSHFLSSGIKTILPGETKSDPVFSVKAFRHQFVSYDSISVSITYLSGKSKKQHSKSYDLDIAHLTRLSRAKSDNKNLDDIIDKGASFSQNPLSNSENRLT